MISSKGERLDYFFRRLLGRGEAKSTIMLEELLTISANTKYSNVIAKGMVKRRQLLLQKTVAERERRVLHAPPSIRMF